MIPRAPFLRFIGAVFVLTLAFNSRAATLAEALASVPAVSIDKQVPLSDVVFYNGVEEALATAIGGAAGAVVLHAMTGNGVPTASNRIKAFLLQEKIDVGEIVRAEFDAVLGADPRFKSLGQQDGGPRLQLVVYNYGLARTGGLATEMRTLVGVRAKLLSEAGGVLAEGREFVRSSDARLPAATLDSFFKQPDLLRAGFTKAARIVAADMLAR